MNKTLSISIILFSFLFTQFNNLNSIIINPDSSITITYYQKNINTKKIEIDKIELFYKNGKIKEETNYRDNKKNGYSITYFDNGKIELEGKYINGKKNGKWILNEENGYNHFTYKNGELNGAKIINRSSIDLMLEKHSVLEPDPFLDIKIISQFSFG